MRVRRTIQKSRSVVRDFCVVWTVYVCQVWLPKLNSETFETAEMISIITIVKINSVTIVT